MENANATEWANAVTAAQATEFDGSAPRMLENIWSSGHATGVAIDYDADDYNGSRLTSVDGAVIEYDGVGTWRGVS